MNKRVLLHSIAWLLFSIFIFFSQRSHLQEVPTGTYIFVQTLLILQTLTIYYLIYLVVVPRFLIKKRQLTVFFLSFLGLIVLSYLLSFLLKLHVDQFKDEVVSMSENLKITSGSIITAFFFMVFATGARLFRQYNSDRLKRAELKKIAQKAELEALKSKMSPHFLYNAFNTIYALAETKSEKNGEAVLQLSDMMRYITYTSSLTKVLMSEELQFLRSYIDFQKLRMSKPNERIYVDITDPIIDFEVAPLLLISFVENAFKHSNLLKENTRINIHFEADEGGFSYRVSNHIDSNRMTNSGVGISTLKKILDFSYPSQHEIRLWEDDNIYNAELNLKLKDG